MSHHIDEFYDSDGNFTLFPRRRLPREEPYYAGPGGYNGGGHMHNRAQWSVTVREDDADPVVNSLLSSDERDLLSESTAALDESLKNFEADVTASVDPEEHVVQRTSTTDQRQGSALCFEQEMRNWASHHNQNSMPPRRGTASKQHQQVQQGPSSPSSPNTNAHIAAVARVQSEQPLSARSGLQAPHHGMVPVDIPRLNIPPTESMSETASVYSGYFSDESEQVPSASSPMGPLPGYTPSERTGPLRQAQPSQSNTPSPVNQHDDTARPYKCGRMHKGKICEKAYKHRYQLNKHVKNVHTPPEDRPFGCSVPKCGKRFNCKAYLIRHENDVHSDDLPYPCRKCQERFSRAYNRDRHEEKCDGVVSGRVKQRHRAPTAATSVSSMQQGAADGSSVQQPGMGFGPVTPGTASTSDVMDVDGPEYSRYPLSTPTPAPRVRGKGK